MRYRPPVESFKRGRRAVRGQAPFGNINPLNLSVTSSDVALTLQVISKRIESHKNHISVSIMEFGTTGMLNEGTNAFLRLLSLR